MWLIDRVAETKILKALEKGELDDLPGAGEAVQPEDNSYIPGHLRAGYRILKNAGFIPPEMQTRKEIADVESLIRAAQDTERAQTLSKKLQYLLSKLNQCSKPTNNVGLESKYYDQLNKKIC